MEPNVGDANVVKELKKEMSFSFIQEVRVYYSWYVNKVSFGVKKRNSRVRFEEKKRYFTLACIYQGTSMST